MHHHSFENTPFANQAFDTQSINSLSHGPKNCFIQKNQMLSINSFGFGNELVPLFYFLGTSSVVAPDVAVFKMLISHAGVFSFSLSWSSE